MGNFCGRTSSENQNPQSSEITSSSPSKKKCLSPQSSSATSISTFTTPSYSMASTGSLTLPQTEGEILSSSNVKPFTYSVLRNATKNFGNNSLLGEGGFGLVYKGWIDEKRLVASRPGSGTVVAIKKLKPEGFQGHKEWLTEVHYLGQCHHPNLVELIGYCSEGDHRLLVYEFMPKGSLENHLFKTSVQPLSWTIRIKIAVGAARGLSFLHESQSQVIFRDVKASNVLLDAEFNAKLSDFGLAKAGPTGDKTHISTQVMGTRGYAAPEYLSTGRLTAKADVYGFGVMLLELISGKRALHASKVGSEQNLADWARPFLRDKRKFFRIMDPKLEGRYPRKGACIVASLSLQCIDDDAKLRPRMSEVLQKLEKLQDSAVGTKPYNTELQKEPSTGRHALKSPGRTPHPRS